MLRLRRGAPLAVVGRTWWLLVAGAVLCSAGPVLAGGRSARPQVRFAYQDRIADAVSVVAVAKGFFSREGLAVKPLLFSSGPACTEAVVTGSAELGTMGDTTAVISVARAPVTIIASHGGGERRHRLIVKADSRLRSPRDLIGKRVAVAKGTSTYGGLLAWARAKRLDLTKVQVINLKPEDMGTALLSGAVDAAAASEPTPSVMEAKGGRELAAFGGLGSNYPILLVARNDFLRQHPEVATRFVRAMSRAAEYVRAHPRETAQLLAAKNGLSLARTERAMKLHYYRVQLDAQTRRSLQEIAAFLVGQKILDRAPDLRRTVTDRYVPKR